MQAKDIIPLVKESFTEWSEDKASRLAAALAYYTIFSISPLLIIVIVILGQVLAQETAQADIIAQIREVVGQQGAEFIEGMIENASRPEGSILATIVGVVTLLLGASGVFGQLHDSLNTIWDVEPEPSQGIMGTIKKRFLSFTMVLGVGFLLLVSLVINAALSAVDNFVVGLNPNLLILARAINFLVSFGVITLLFALIFKIIPDVDIAWRDVWVGAVVTALLFTIGRVIISQYLATSAATSVYGAAGALVIILLWVYYSAQILFLGAEFTQVYARRHGSRRSIDARSGQPAEEAARQEAGRHGDVSPTGPWGVSAVYRPEATALAGRWIREEVEEIGTGQYYVIAVLALLIGLWRLVRGSK